MRTAAVVIAACAAVAAASAGTAVAGRSADDRAAVVAVLQREVSALNAARWQLAWQLYSPRFRATCDYAKWRAASAQGHAQAPEIAVRVLRVRLAGNHAYLTYRMSGSFGTRTTTDDVYVKVGGKWYDELDASTGPCFKRSASGPIA